MEKPCFQDQATVGEGGESHLILSETISKKCQGICRYWVLIRICFSSKAFKVLFFCTEPLVLTKPLLLNNVEVDILDIKFAWD